MIRGAHAGAAGSAAELLTRGFVHVRRPHATKLVAWAAAQAVFDAAGSSDALGAGMPAPEVVGEFTVPPTGAPHRDFQTLHIDFGVPIYGLKPVDVARFTALYIDADRPPVAAQTRIVALRSLLGQRAWSDQETLKIRLGRYGALSDRDKRGYVEGILARLVEAVDDSFTLPSTDEPGFLCGQEFADIDEEHLHFSKHLLDVDRVEHRVPLGPGELLLFDNLAVAHGRVGARLPEELHQLCVGYRGLDPAQQAVVLARVLTAFSAHTSNRLSRVTDGG